MAGRIDGDESGKSILCGRKFDAEGGLWKSRRIFAGGWGELYVLYDIDGDYGKDRPEIYDYNIPQALRDVYARKDFGPYTQDGEVPVCFVANNHTTGGNSGSPVLNADGHLIGINFDRAWEGVMSDMQYDPEICRNIAVDIRYVLFVIDKVAGAGHLLNEMEIIR